MLTPRGRRVVQLVGAVGLTAVVVASLSALPDDVAATNVAETTTPAPGEEDATTAPDAVAEPAVPPSPSPTPTPDPTEARRAIEAQQAAAIDELLGTMSTQDKVRQLLVIPVYGASIDDVALGNQQLHGTDTARQALEQHRPGGVILFRTQAYGDTANLTSLDQTTALTEQLHAVTEVPVFVATDQEHGMVERLPESATLLPSLMALASGGTETARAAAHLTAEQLSAVGIDVNFAPVADVQTNPDNPVIGVRSAGADPSRVSAIVDAQVEGYLGTGVAPTVKHFPGHGDTDVDSHRSLPRIEHDRERLDRVELAPFRAAIDADVPLIMTGHLQVPALDPSGAVATLSEPVVTDLLREELGFDGVVVSDSMQMNAVRSIAGDGELAVRAVEAGVDLVLMPTSTADAIRGLEEAVASGRITATRLDGAVRRVLRLKAQLGLLKDLAPATPRAADHVDRIATDDAVSLARSGLTHISGVCTSLPDGPVAVVGAADAPAVRATVDALEARGVAASLLEVRNRPSSEDRASAIRAAAPASLTIIWADVSQAEWRSLVSAVDEANTTIVVLTGVPDAGSVGVGDSVMAAFGDAAVQGTAVVELLDEQARPPGALPVLVDGVPREGADCAAPG